MKKNLRIAWIKLLLIFFVAISPSLANEDGLGQIIKINTRLDAFVGKPSWLLVIRDLDHNQNIPYMFDFTRGDNFWLAFTYGRHYLITASTLQYVTYQPKHNNYFNHKIHNFCHLESQGRIIRGQSMHVTITGNLTANTSTFHCQVSQFPDSRITGVLP